MPATASPSEAPVLSGALLRRFDVAGPRYTSYPTADRFVEAFGADDYRRGLAQHAEGAAIGGCPPLSLYVHVPFCESICYYCACNKVITEHHERAAEYLDALEREIALHTVVLGSGQPVSQLYLGGGTPTFLNDAELERLMASIRRNFALVAGAETSIEVDPRTVSGERLAFLAKLGFNRLSFGVQDFDPQVQKAVNRVQPFDSVRELVERSRTIGFESINVDLILLGFEMMGEPRREAFEQAAERYVNFYHSHMAMEEEQILPLAERVLTVDDWADLDQAFGANRDPLTGHEAEADYRALFTRIVGLVPAPTGLGTPISAFEARAPIAS